MRTKHRPPVGWITREELERKLLRGRTVVLDPRPPDHYRASHIPGALNLPPRTVRRLVPDRGTEIVVYGPRTDSEHVRRLVDRLAAEEYTDVRILVGGLGEWMRFGLPVRSAEAAPTGARPSRRARLAAWRRRRRSSYLPLPEDATCWSAETGFVSPDLRAAHHDVRDDDRQHEVEGAAMSTRLR